MIETILLVFIVAKLRRYRISPLFKSWTIYPVLFCTVVYTILEKTIFSGNYSFVQYSSIFKFLYLAAALLLVLKYKLYGPCVAGSVCIILGTILNKIVIAANGGKMPVFPTLSALTGYIKPDTLEIMAQAGDFHVSGSEATNLVFLSDIIDVGYSIMSIGDVLFRAFFFIIIFYSIKALNKEGSMKENLLDSAAAASPEN